VMGKFFQGIFSNMNLSSRLLPGLLLILGLLVCLEGCGGSSKGKVTGKITKGTEPLKVSKQGKVQLILYPYPDVPGGKKYKSYPAMVQDDATFEVTDVPTGKYLFAVEQLDPMPATDLLEGKFGKDRSEIIRDVTGKEPINIDVGKPKGE